MRTVGLIVEYNPLHNGHVHHFRQAMQVAQAEASIAVISGHFLQRGEPAIANKWARTEMALRMGIDVVIELPVTYSVQPAEWFAYGAVCLLDATGLVDSLCFGSEDGRIEPLMELAGMLYREPESFRHALKQRLKQGHNYPAAYAMAVQDALGGSGDFADGVSHPAGNHPPVRLDLPNNILGLHYLIALRRLDSRIRPLTIPRLKAGYHDETPSDGAIASATAIRKLIAAAGVQAAAPYVPQATLDILRREMAAGQAPMSWERYWPQIAASLLVLSPEELGNLHEMQEGLEHRFIQAMRQLPPDRPPGVNALLQLAKTKRYTHVKLQRALVSILLNRQKHDYTREKLAQGPSHIRVLGFSSRGRELLRRMKQTAKLPVITNVSREHGEAMEPDIRATAAYALGYDQPSPRDWFRDYYEPPLAVEGD